MCPPTGREGSLAVESIARGQWFNQSWLCNEASIKPQKDRVQRASRWWTHGDVGKGVPGEGMEAPHLFPYTLPYASLPSGCFWVSISIYNKLVIEEHVSLSSVTCSCNLIEPDERGSWEALIYSQSEVQVSEMGSGAGAESFNPLRVGFLGNQPHL